MAKNDREHFEDYRAQTFAKHTILEKYIYAYFNIMKGTAEPNLVYIDGFAGRGTYDTPTGEVAPGSPLRALHKIASLPNLASRVTTIFIERDKKLFLALDREVREFHAQHPTLRQPQMANAEFSTAITSLLDALSKDGANLAPAFVFIDPCGVDGVDFEVVKRVLQNERCEVFIFFNVDGIRRILGLGERMADTLTHLLGNEARAQELASVFDSLRGNPAEREEAIVQFYEKLLREETTAKYVVSFRVEKEDRRTTGHYLIHASRHPLGFAIMKDVMWSVGQTAEGKGGLALEQASLVTMEMLFTPDWEAIKRGVLLELAAGQRRVSHFYTTLAQQADNRLCQRAYRAALLELEEEGKIVVLDKEGKSPAPTRRMIKGKKTLAEGYYVRLA